MGSPSLARCPHTSEHLPGYIWGDEKEGHSTAHNRGRCCLNNLELLPPNLELLGTHTPASYIPVIKEKLLARLNGSLGEDPNAVVAIDHHDCRDRGAGL